MRVDYSAYEGRKVKGVAEIVIVGGQVLVENGEFKGRAGNGRFLKRGTFA
jgi:dihydropyrimidinase